MLDSERFDKFTLELAHRSLLQVITEAGILVFIALIALLGNSCVLYVFYKSPSLRRVTSYYLIALSISDVVLALSIMPFNIVNAVHGHDVFVDQIGQGVGLIAFSLIAGSLQTTTLIAVNRFFCVVKPSIYRKYFKPKPAIKMIIGSWILSTLVVILFYVTRVVHFKYSPGSFIYLFYSYDQKIERVFIACIQFCFVMIPLSITLLCYSKVHHIVKEHNTNVSSNLNAGNTRNRPSLTKQEIHITKSVLALVCEFIICWIPSATLWHISLYINLPRSAELVITYTAYASSAINPIVYNIFNKPFRKQFLKIFGLVSPRVGIVNVQTVEQ